MKFIRGNATLLVLAVLAVLCAVYVYCSIQPAPTPVAAPEVRISPSAVLAASDPVPSVRPALKGTEIAAVASDAKMVLSVQVRPKNATQRDSVPSTGSPTGVSAGVPATDCTCEPVDLRIALSEDQNGTPRAAVTDLNGGEVQAHLEFLAAAPKRNYRVGIGTGLRITSKGTETLYNASVARRVQERTWIRLDATKSDSGASLMVSAEYEF